MINYKKLSIKEIIDLLIKSDIQYYNLGEPIFNDDEYDEIKDYLKTIDKKNDYFKRVGADVAIDNKVKLPFYLGSQDKIKDDDKTLQKWLKKYNKPSSYVISEKLDGISCLIIINNNNIRIYTRGNGIYGQDITQLKDIIKGIPVFNDKHKLAIRGELIISKNNWTKIADKGANARNVVAGTINSKVIDKNIAKYIEFIAYDVLNPRNNIEKALEYAASLKFNVVKYIIKSELSISSLYDLFKNWKETSNYEIDGLVITHNDIYKIKSGENPKYSFAFKSLKMHEEVDVIVTDIEWNISKDKYIKPIVKFNEIKLNGVKIKQATGFNADYIVKNIIGVGSKITIIRSGDVIPYIKNVLKPATNGKPLLPLLPFKWKGKDIILENNAKNREQDIKIYTYFMKTLNIKGIGEGIITKLYDNSYDTLYKIINISKNELLNIDGFKEKSANNLIESLKSIKTKKCLEIMHASNLLGRGLGEKKLNLVFDVYPFICSDQEKTLKLTVDDLKKINGLGELSATLIISNLKTFLDFYNSLNIDNGNGNGNDNDNDNDNGNGNGNDNDNDNGNDKYKDNIYVFTGIRDKDLEKIIISSGGKIANIVNKKTTLLIVKDYNDNTVKVKTARSLNIPIITYDDFIK
jgi:NAD-dependent DNA ligase